MPIVPKLAPEVGLRPLPAAAQPLGTGAGEGLGALGEGAQKIAAALDRYAAQKLEEADGIAVTEAVGKLSDETITLVSETQKRRGREAVGATQRALEQFEGRANALRGQLANERQVQAYDRIRLARRAELHQSLLRWEDDEIERFGDETAEASIESAIQRALALRAEPQALAGALAEIQALRATQSARKKWDPATLKMLTLRDTSRLHSAMIDLIPETQIDLARAYYTDHKDQMLGTDRARIEDYLARGEKVTRSMAATDSILRQTATPEAAYAAARQLPGAIRDEAMQRLDDHFARNERLEAERIETAWQKAQEEFRAAGYRLAGVSIKTRTALPATGPYSEEQLLQAERDWHTPRVDPYAGLAAYARWSLLPDADKKLVDPLLMLGRAVPPDLLRAAIRERADLANPPQKGVSFAQIRDRALAQAAARGAFAGLTRDQEQTRRGQLATWLLDRLQGQEDEKGAYPAEVAQRTLDEATIQGKLRQDWWFDRPMFRFEVPAAQSDRFYTAPAEELSPRSPVEAAPGGSPSPSGANFPRYYDTLRSQGLDLPPDPRAAPFDVRAMYRAGIQPERQPDGSLRVPELFRRSGDQLPDDPPPALRAQFEAALRARGLIATDEAIRESYLAWIQGP